jgi:hypothetical protein
MLHPAARVLTFVSVLLWTAAPARATWYGENVAKGSDIMMMDVRWPWWPESTYYANWNFGTAPTGLGGYGGFAGSLESLEPDHRPNLDPQVQADFRPGSVWSFWGSNKEGEPVRVAACSQYTYPRQYIGEGASGSLGGPVWPFIRQNHWYTMLMRVWEPLGQPQPLCSYIGRRVKDIDDHRWHLYGIMRLPVPAKSFTGNAGFLEDCGHGGRSVRSLHRRLGYCRKDGQWLKSDTVTYDVPPRRGEMDTYWIANVLPEGDHEYLAMELSGNSALLPVKLQGKPLELGKKHSFTVKQPARPALDRPAVTHVTAISNGRQVAVSWEIPDDDAPQFAYQVEVFERGDMRQSRTWELTEAQMPTVRTVLLDTEVAHPTVRLTVTDVFDQTAKPVVVAATHEATPSTPPTVTAQPGLKYQYLIQDSLRHEPYFYPARSLAGQHEEHHWLSLAEIDRGHRMQSGIARGLDTTVGGERTAGYAYRFRGLLRVPTTGLYVLYAQGADGYRIALDGRDTLTWDGPHGPAERAAVVTLAEGDHPLAVDYFVDRAAVPFFKLEWEGPGVPRKEIPADALLHAAGQPLPEMMLSATGGSDGTATIRVNVAPRGHAVAKTHLMLGKLQIAESSGDKLVYRGMLPDGDSTVWARLVYDRDHTLDCQPRAVRVTGPAVEGWNISVAGEAKSRRGLWQAGPNSFAFFGEGEYVVSRPIDGDFTLTCRVDSFAGAKGEPVNPLSWVGLTAREFGDRGNYRWGREFGIMQTGRAGLRTTPDHSDLGGSRINDYTLPANHPWLRIVRQGNQWTAWSSADGHNWRHGATHFIPARRHMDAGLVFRALPQDARAYFQATVSQLALVPGVVADIVMPAPPAATDTDGPRLTGVTMAPSDAQVVVVRSASRGLLRTVDGGRHWSDANGNLSGAANCVRSMAIHPRDARIMLRAAGRADDHGMLQSTLLATRDGGRTWQPLPFPGDFDGDGPSALCGEVLAFDPADPDIVLAGCESKGFFRSNDGGNTWKPIGAAGQRITAVAVNRWIRGQDGKALVQVVTCADQWMPLLGRGRPARTAEAKISRDYLSRDGGRTLWQTCERCDLGYFNFAFDKGTAEESPYATSHGLLKSLGAGERSFLLPPSKNVDWLRPVTLLAASGIDDGRCGRCLAGALTPSQPARFSRSNFFAFAWNWLTPTGDDFHGGPLAACGEFRQGKLWWLLTTDGLYCSRDGGQTLQKCSTSRANRCSEGNDLAKRAFD